MDRPIQVRRARQGEVAAFLARQREEQAKAARAKAPRDKAWYEDVLDADMELYSFVHQRLKTDALETPTVGPFRMPSQAEKRAAILLALRQGVPLMLLLIVTGIPVALWFGSAGETPLLAAIAGLVWYVHSRMMANLKEMLTETGPA